LNSSLFIAQDLYRQQDSVCGYFDYLSTMDFINWGEFLNYWGRLKAIQNPKELSWIMHHLCVFYNHCPNQDQKDALNSFLQENIAQWCCLSMEAMPYFDPEDFAYCIDSLANLDVKPNLEFIKAWHHHALNKIDQFTDSDFTMILRGFLKLGIPIENDLSDILGYVLPPVLEECSASDHILFLNLYKHKDEDLSPEVFRTYCHSVAKKIDDFSVVDLVKIWKEFSVLQKIPDPDFIIKWRQRIIKNIGHIKAADLADLFISCVKLDGCLNESFLTILEHSMLNNIDEFSANQLSNIYWGYAVLDVLKIKGDNNHYPNVLDCIYQKIQNMPFFSIPEKSAISNASKQFNKDCPFDIAIQVDFNAHSRLEAVFYRKTKECNIGNIEAIYKVPELNYEGDFMHISDEKQIFIEVDGPSHFVTDHQGGKFYNSKTKLMSSLILKSRPEAVLLRFPYDFVQSQESHRLKDVFQKALQLQNGAYVVRNAEGQSVTFSALL